MLNKTKTNDLLHAKRPHKALLASMSIMCHNGGETHGHLFLHCPVGRDMWQILFAIDGKMWLIRSTVEEFLFTSFVGFW